MCIRGRPGGAIPRVWGILNTDTDTGMATGTDTDADRYYRTGLLSTSDAADESTRGLPGRRRLQRTNNITTLVTHQVLPSTTQYTHI